MTSFKMGRLFIKFHIMADGLHLETRLQLLESKQLPSYPVPAFIGVYEDKSGLSESPQRRKEVQCCKVHLFFAF